MSATGRSLPTASQNFTDHLNRTLNRTLTHQRLISVIDRRAHFSTIQFRVARGAVPVRLNSQFGPIDLEITLYCVAEAIGSGQLRLRIVWYRYALRPEGHREPMFRWERAWKR